MFPEPLYLCFKVIEITITQNSRGWWGGLGGEEKDSIPVSSSCYHRGTIYQFQKLFLSTRVIFTCFGDFR